MKAHQIKERAKESYGNIALEGVSDGCCVSSGCCGSSISSTSSPLEIATNVGYDIKDLESIPESSILGVGCGAPVNFADIHEGEVVVDIGSGGGIDVFLSANKVKDPGKIIGIDMTDEMLEKSRHIAEENGYTNVEFKKGDIERGIPIESNAANVVISNCVINLTVDKVAALREIYRILKTNGRMIISDLVTDKQIDTGLISPEKWCSCIDGAITQENYLDSISKAGFTNIEVINEKGYTEEDGRKITSVVTRAVKE